MTEPIRNLVHVVETLGGWWDVKTQSGTILGQFTTEFQARDAGRISARRLQADLAIHQNSGPTLFWMYDDAEGTMKPREVTGGAEKKPMVLLVEDLVDSRELYAQYLNYVGFSVVTAINGHEAIRLAQLLRPDIILMDIRLPGMDGLEATADLKRQPELSHIPVVAITADPSKEMAARCRDAGCHSLVSKPVLPNEVAQHLRNVLSNAADSGTR